jgi:hypothetical protein
MFWTSDDKAYRVIVLSSLYPWIGLDRLSQAVRRSQLNRLYN